MVELCKLTAHYGGGDILKNIDLTLRPGELTVIVGPNGCGKSTLLRRMVGMTPGSGTVTVEGRDTAALSPAERARLMAYLPQSRPVPDMTVGQLVLHGRFPYLSYPRRYRREDIAAAQKAMETMGISELSERSLSTLSGGTRQKCYIAMALAQSSPVILMDEPTAALDMARRLDLLELCRILAAGGKTMVLVLHELELALRFADRLAVMDSGRVVTTGTPAQVLESGALERVFDLSIQTFDTPQGRRFFFERRK